MSKVHPIDPIRPDMKVIASAAAHIKNGGMVIFPTRHLYGIAVDPWNPAAVRRLFETKMRPPHKPILILTPSEMEVTAFTVEIPPIAKLMMDAFWPGNITLVLKAARTVPDTITAGTGKIGIRISAHPVASALAKCSGMAITGTSANESGCPGVNSIDHLSARLHQTADLILDAGTLIPGTGSTVVDATPDRPIVLREGTISRSEIQKILESGR
ncbi:MAG: threonylcarbamoyl-AMP synthase [Desulfobacteraceae bacterium]|nr:threonylcarbamoyl-AMP synthase [Desulfobacteraceae bacterium]